MVALLSAVFLALMVQFTSFNDHRQSILEGNWQSCTEKPMAQYSERIYDGKINGQPFEFHMGPYHDFALFQGQQDEHREHDSAENLLQPYTVDVVNGFGEGHWRAFGLQVDVVVAGGSREDCESWFVTVKPLR